MHVRAPQVREDEEKERRGGGFWLQFSKKLGLGPAYPPCAGPVSLGVSKAAPAGLNLLETLLGTDAGLVAVLMAGTTAAIVVGVIGHGAFTQGTAAVEASAGPWALFPIHARSASPAAAPASADGSSSSLEYLAQASRKDAWLRERIGGSGAEAGPGAGMGAGASSRSDPSRVPPPPDSPAAVGPACDGRSRS